MLCMMLFFTLTLTTRAKRYDQSNAIIRLFSFSSLFVTLLLINRLNDNQWCEINNSKVSVFSSSRFAQSADCSLELHVRYHVW